MPVLVGQALSTGMGVWLTYMALEPAVRRRWPDALVSWSRLIAGRYKDPIVGRDVLVGVLAGLAITFQSPLARLVPAVLGWAPAGPQLLSTTLSAPWHMAFFFFLFAGVLALLMRIQLAVPNNDFLSAELYNQVFTVHGSVMMFLFALPLFEAIAVLLLPQMLGARDLPFPRLSAFGFWCFLIGGVFLCGSIFFDAAPHGGWFMYPPLTSRYQPDIGADIWLLGFSFIEVAAIAAAVEMIVGTLKCRPPGMRINLIPLYAWYVLVAAAMILFAFPPLIAGSMLLEIERAFGWPSSSTSSQICCFSFELKSVGSPSINENSAWRTSPRTR